MDHLRLCGIPVLSLPLADPQNRPGRGQGSQAVFLPHGRRGWEARIQESSPHLDQATGKPQRQSSKSLLKGKKHLEHRREDLRSQSPSEMSSENVFLLTVQQA